MGYKGRRQFRHEGPQHPHRINEHIRIAQIRVIMPDGEQAGIMTPDQGRDLAHEHGLDLVEVSPDARPPVCRLMDYGKYRYEQSKRKSASNSARTSVKTIRLRPKTDDHDLQTKLRAAESFLAKGNAVRLEMRMRGRENAYPGRWIVQMNEFLALFELEFDLVSKPRAEGRSISATLQPISNS